MFARAAKKKELDRYVEAGARHYEVDGIRVVLVHRLLRINEQVNLGLKSIFFVKDITIKGINL